MTCGYFRPINEEYLSTGQIFFIDRLTVVSAAHFHANTTVLRQNVSKLIMWQTLWIFFSETPCICMETLLMLRRL